MGRIGQQFVFLRLTIWHDNKQQTAGTILRDGPVLMTVVQAGTHVSIKRPAAAY
ncbi:hypothetical protein KNP414_07125 [Paenibacillus mucilaginosus KNP414]|uniref:Uncharacterized protein n=1 Tax=Paenibacillus mucilaginosus (strain KNP414) TaxID=1036673 RepID=F8FM09_PAEMK|nr:hypothetical protein KNP414_07125 [Paenibacillus mucilaginosus KNP414]